MKFLGVAALLATANAHYTFPSVGSTGDWEVVRKTDNFQHNGPVTDVTGGLMTCYQTTMDGNVGVLDVKAGSTVTYNAKSAVSHPGPMNVYIAKAPAGTAVEDFDGKGAVWMKIQHAGPTFSGGAIQWPFEGATKIPVKLPSCLEDGEYLLRIEHIAMHSAGTVGGAQLYISCAQLNVSGGTGGIKAPRMLSFPGSYSPQDPGLLLNIYWPVPTSYQIPGGEDATC